ncbi:site-2 protease family protein [Streptomyces sp. NBC_01262]|uniref:site-2 protease family protein n=1 Tax=Streptomyces sp. NBC_01262 TaxID=2903803 RepID=UPI002E309B39|nr:site-2 protease family protein [Streptomyces sp. NBC_01262]
MSGSVRIGTVRGVVLHVHWSLPVLLLLLVYGLAGGTRPAAARGQAPGAFTAWAAGVVVLLLASLVIHGAANVLASRAAGVRVRSLTLWALGGTTGENRPASPRAAFATAVGGPLAGLLLGGTALGTAAATDLTIAAEAAETPWALLAWPGAMNVTLAVSNLLPAAPLDGGKLLQATVWWRTGDRERANGAAGRSGQAVGVLLVAGSLVAVLAQGTAGGLWLGLLGVFLWATALVERRLAALRAALRGVPVADAMTGPVVTCPDWLTVDRFLREPPRTTQSVVPLLDFEGRPSGVLPVRRAALVTPALRGTMRVRELALPASLCLRARPDEALDEVIARATPRAGLPILVMDGGRVTAVVTAADLRGLLDQHAAPAGAAPPVDGRG